MFTSDATISNSEKQTVVGNEYDQIIHDKVLTSLGKLPNCTAHIREGMNWNITFSDYACATFVAGGTGTGNGGPHEVLVTLGQPVTYFPGGTKQDITYKRLSYMIDVVAPGKTIADTDSIAEKVQLIVNEGSHAGTKEQADGTEGANKLWGMLDGNYKGQCYQAAVLMGLMVGQIGIPAEYWEVFASECTPIRCKKGAGLNPRSELYTDPNMGILEMYFVESGPFNGFNEGENCCWINGRLYAGFSAIIGVGQGNKTAEHDVLLKLDAGQVAKGNNKLQRWTNDEYGPSVPVPPVP